MQGNIGLYNPPESRLLIENLPKSSIFIREIIRISGKGPLLALILEIGKLKLLGKDAAKVVGIGLQLMGTTFTLACPAFTAALILAHRLLADALTLVFLARLHLIVDKFLFHGGWHHHHLIISIPARLHHLAHPDLPGKTILFSLPVPFQQVIKRMHRRNWQKLRRRTVLQKTQIIPVIQAPGPRRPAHDMHIGNLARLFGQAHFILDHLFLFRCQPLLFQGFVEGLQFFHRLNLS